LKKKVGRYAKTEVKVGKIKRSTKGAHSGGPKGERRLSFQNIWGEEVVQTSKGKVGSKKFYAGLTSEQLRIKKCFEKQMKRTSNEKKAKCKSCAVSSWKLKEKWPTG